MSESYLQKIEREKREREEEAEKAQRKYARFGRALWKGERQIYYYDVYHIDYEQPEGEYGNYIFAKEVNKDNWIPIYIGQGHLKERKKEALEEGCVTRKGATHFHVHPHKNSSDLVREKEEALLIDNNPLCLVENGGCNERKPKI